ncbi:ferredoxin [Actinosynnema sp. NPDC059335]|uniref:ferredoxin n=1 Tax=Actinosynnema sp. NPDC059335 TaxID=3346804 RepID=UPI00366A6E65
MTAKPRATLSVDQETCRGTGLCQALAPRLFRLDPYGEAEVLRAELTEEEDVTQADAVMSTCPTESVILKLLA